MAFLPEENKGNRVSDLYPGARRSQKSGKNTDDWLSSVTVRQNNGAMKRVLSRFNRLLLEEKNGNTVRDLLS